MHPLAICMVKVENIAGALIYMAEIEPIKFLRCQLSLIIAQPNNVISCPRVRL